MQIDAAVNVACEEFFTWGKTFLKEHSPTPNLSTTWISTERKSVIALERRKNQELKVENNKLRQELRKRDEARNLIEKVLHGELEIAKQK